MPRKKSKGNGQGSVYPRKNKEGKLWAISEPTTVLMESVDMSPPKASLSVSAN
jgi:hypothetical protein